MSRQLYHSGHADARRICASARTKEVDIGLGCGYTNRRSYATLLIEIVKFPGARMTHPVLERQPEERAPATPPARRRLPVAVGLLFAAVLTFAATSLFPTSHDAAGWGLRGLLFVGMWWAVR